MYVWMSESQAALARLVFSMQFDVTFSLIQREREQWVALASRCDNPVLSCTDWKLFPTGIAVCWKMHEWMYGAVIMLELTAWWRLKCWLSAGRPRFYDAS